LWARSVFLFKFLHHYGKSVEVSRELTIVDVQKMTLKYSDASAKNFIEYDMC
jgi:hypothetical protein